jgi:methylmalonyl-CoA/ethylmalonyl-CoA epimerase
VPDILFDHIALAVPRMADAPATLVGRLGGVPAYGMSSRFYRFGHWAFANRARIEVLEPLGENGFLHRFIAQRGPGVHHVTFTVPSARQACDRARAAGYDIVGFDDSDPEWIEAFLHPRQALGIVVQIAESHPVPGADSTHGWQAPPGPANPPPPATVLGLRMRAHSVERARRQWSEVLEGVEDARAAGELIYRWPGSPMWIVVELDPARDEGALGIEFTSSRPAERGDIRDAALGVTFLARPAAS